MRAGNVRWDRWRNGHRSRCDGVSCPNLRPIMSGETGGPARYCQPGRHVTGPTPAPLRPCRLAVRTGSCIERPESEVKIGRVVVRVARAVSLLRTEAGKAACSTSTPQLLPFECSYLILRTTTPSPNLSLSASSCDKQIPPLTGVSQSR